PAVTTSNGPPMTLSDGSAAATRRPSSRATGKLVNRRHRSRGKQLVVSFVDHAQHTRSIWDTGSLFAQRTFAAPMSIDRELAECCKAGRARFWLFWSPYQ